MFEIVNGSPREVWVPIVDLDTIYIGQLVACQANEGIVPLGTATGANDTTGKVVPMGIVVGLNLRTPAYDSTYKTEKVTDVSPLNNTVEYALHGGPYSFGETAAMAKIAIIDACTVIRGPIFNAAFGTAMTVGTVSTGDANGVSATSSALEVAGVATLAAMYFRTGANRGIYRITDDSSTTALTWDKATPHAVAVDDTLVRANGLRLFGPSRVQFDSESLYINSAAALTTDYYGIDVITLDLSEAGKESVEFRFNADHFCLKRA